MADLKKDASTDIETNVKAFVKDINTELEKLRKKRLEATKKAEKSGKKKTGSKEAETPEVKFELSKAKVSKSRTPEEQAKLVVAGSTQVCWSSHMADKARHVIMKVDGKVNWKPKKTLGDDYTTFTKKWGEVMKKKGLKNAEGKDGMFAGDEFHLELPDSKIKKSSERAKSCLDEYARLTRKESKKKNAKFEKRYSKLLKTYIEKYEKEVAKKTAK